VALSIIVLVSKNLCAISVAPMVFFLTIPKPHVNTASWGIYFKGMEQQKKKLHHLPVLMSNRQR
jgi:hypothetical protein